MNKHTIKTYASLFLMICSSGLFGTNTPIDSLKQLLQHAEDAEEKIALLTDIAQYYLSNAMDSSSHAYVEQAIALAEATNNMTAWIDASTVQLKLYTTIGEMEAAYEVLPVIDSVIHIHGSTTQQGKLLFHQGYLNYIEGSYDQAITVYEEAMKIFQAANETDSYMETYQSLGAVYIRIGDFENARKIYRELLLMNEENKKDKNLKYKITNNIAVTYSDQGNYFEAIRHYESIYKELENKLLTVEDSLSASNILSNIGLLYLNLEDFKESKQYFSLALELRNKNITDYEAALIYGNLGEACLELKEYETAHSYYLKAHEVAQLLNDPFEIAYAEYSLGKSSFYLEKPQLSETYFLSALKTFKELNLVQEQANVYLELAKLYQARGTYQDALDYALYANKNAVQASNNWMEQQSAYLLAQLYEQERNFEQSLVYYKRYLELYMNRQDPSMMRKVFTYQTEMEYERKAEQTALQQASERKNRRNIILITLLFLTILFFFAWNRYQAMSQKNRLITKQSEELQQLNATKDKLFSIIGHDLRSPIGNLVTTLNLFFSKELSQKEFMEMADHLRQSTSNIYQMLNNLLHWANAQMKGSIRAESKALDLKQQIDFVHDFIKDTARAKGIQIHNKLTTPLKVLADPNQVDLVLRNLIGNAVKFTNTGGQIHIEVQTADQTAIVSVQDNGIGMTQEQQAHLFDAATVSSNWGTANEKGLGLGLNLCKEMIEKNGGEIWVDSEPNKGSRFYFTLPLTS
ncbi:MAG: tetratricopeptide repeat-containing sensor histidine kinase [Bacteroidota bacterium]